MEGNNTDNFRYWAFVSYSSKDKVWAQRLHKALETYSIPRDLRGRPGRDGPVPAKIFPVFRDRDELPLSSDLGGTIQDALRASRYLIVLCSPNSAKSQWVNEEIRYFKSLGRDDRILALIIDGEPGSTDQGKPHNESFPEALRYKVTDDGTITDRPCEPIGGDLRKGGDGWQRSFLKAIAGITGLGFDAFARREAKRTRRRRALAATAALVALIAGFFVWDHYRLKTDYYQSMTFAHGEPLGLGEVSIAEYQQRYRTFRFQHSQGKVRTVEIVRASGHLAEVEEPTLEFPAFSRLDVDYGEGGQVVTHRYYHHTGDEILQLNFSNDLKTIDRILPADEGAVAAGGGSVSIGSSGWAAPLNGSTLGEASSTISRYVLTYDEQGQITEVSYRNAWGSPVRDQDGAFKLQLKRDSLGRIVQAVSVDSHGHPVTSKISSAAQKRFLWDNRSRLVEESYHDENGEPVLLRTSGFSKVKTLFDNFGNDRERLFFDEHDQPCERFKSHHRIVATYTDTGLISSQKYYRADGSPGRDLPGGTPQMAYTYDQHGRHKQLTYLTLDNQPAANSEGLSTIVNTRDDKGRVIAVSSFNKEGNPVLEKKSGAHRVEYSYDNRGRPNGSSYYGTRGEPVRGQSGYHREERTLDNSGRILAIAYFGPDGQPCLEPRERAHKEVSSYDERGNLRSLRYFGTRGQPIPAISGYHEMRRAWNERGLLAKESYFDSDGQKTLRSDWNLHEVRLDYDDAGNVIRRRFFGLRDEPVCDEQGVHREEKLWDAHGSCLQENYYDDRGNAVVHGDLRAHEIRRQYDSRGHELSTRFFGPDGKAMIRPDGYHEKRQSYDKLGNKKLESYFDTAGNPVERRDLGCHSVRMEFNELGNKISESYFDMEDQPVLRQSRELGTDNHALWPHERRWHFDEFGRLASITNFDVEGNPMTLHDAGATEKRTYDARGFLIKQEHFDAGGNPVIPPGLGWHALASKYRADGHLIEEAYFDNSGSPLLFNNQYHAITYSRDSSGRQTGFAYYGTQGQKIVHPTSRFHEKRITLNAFGRVSGERTFGINGEPVLTADGYHLFNIDYDRYGNHRSRRGYGLEDEPVRITDFDAHEERTQYSPTGDLLVSEYFDEQGQPCLGYGGYHKMIKTYARAGLANSCRFYDPNGQPMMAGSNHTYGWEQDFDSRGLIKEVRNIDARGKIMEGATGYAKKRVIYDAYQRPREILEYFKDGTIRFYQIAHYGNEGSHIIKRVETVEDNR